MKMAACPKCGSRSVSPARGFEAAAERGAESFLPAPLVKVSIGQCEKCGAEFATVEGTKRYVLAPAVDLEKARRAVKTLKVENEAMSIKTKEMLTKEEDLQASIQKATSEGELRVLERKHEVLSENVSYLRVERERLERLASILSLAVPPGPGK